MRKMLAISLISTIFAVANEANVTKNSDELVAKEGVKYIKILGKELKMNVKKRLKADPTGIDAVKFCSENAKSIIEEVSKKFPENIKVRRVATKYRNPNNKPDSTDLEVLKKMEEGLKAQTLPKKPMVVDVNGTKRVYVPLIVEKACLKCHGDLESMNSMVKRVIKKHYPEDKAIGFKEGDLRGAVVAEIAPKK
jgi:hypothetical protein